MIYRWRRLDEPGLETLELERSIRGYRATSTVATFGKSPLTLCYQWHLDRQWRTRHLSLQRLRPSSQQLHIERHADGWWINGCHRRELASCEEIDLSVSPFCNSVAIQQLIPQLIPHLIPQLRDSAAITALFIDADTLDIQPSRQRYQYLRKGNWRYIDEGIACGFEARLQLDNDGLVTRYEGLFEAVP
ncbi:putative glycolipid-binding domain-containing protein [Halomonas huangheensis]|uniref:Glycolipid-binding domain-containing protein n=1 Tax=Halomonas huangheensis TaxID=1178482 RepID=W1N441_9GAMM|nr:putative glycolipid-binding domain-containing protein [Halomonas huangheensis]ALM51476.1 hypothetical protein AR456_03570 [Halomonas huangheensis]ERL49931.1 hypothetical protein BJB45_02060 [Halomonas huangheensis]